MKDSLFKVLWKQARFELLITCMQIQPKDKDYIYLFSIKAGHLFSTCTVDCSIREHFKKGLFLLWAITGLHLQRSQFTLCF